MTTAYIPSLRKKLPNSEAVKKDAYIPSLRKKDAKVGNLRNKASSEAKPVAAPDLQATGITVTVPEIRLPESKAAEVTVNVPEVKIPEITVNIPEIRLPEPKAVEITVNVPEVKIPPIVINYDDKHISILSEILKEMIESNKINLEEVSAAAKSSNQSADEATNHLRKVLELTKDLNRPFVTDSSDGDVSLDGGSALRFISNIETKASSLGELQVVRDSLIDSGELLKFKTSTQDIIVALIASVTQLFRDTTTLHQELLKLQN